MAFPPLNFSQNSIFLSFENAPKMEAIQMALFPLSASLALAFMCWVGGSGSDGERGAREVEFSACCTAPPVRWWQRAGDLGTEREHRGPLWTLTFGTSGCPFVF